LHRNTPLSLDSEGFRRLGYELVDAVADFLEGIPDGPVSRDETPGQVRALLSADRTLPEAGGDPAEILRAARALLFDHSLFNGHPRFLGYITSSPAPIGILGDLLASAVNPNVGAWRLSPMATEIEGQSIRWIAELIGYPAECGGLFVSGGNMANIICLLTARLAAADWDLRGEGVASGSHPLLRVYASQEAHTWLQKGCDLSGIGTDAIRWIPVDDGLRMHTDALGDAIARDRAVGERPMVVIGTAGSVSTGAIDPLAEIASICREAGVWFHVDGAYGAFAAALTSAPEALRGLALADSIAVDPHKWLYAPLEAGCALVRNPEALRSAFSYHPPYYHFGEEATNYFDFGPQNSRGFRALKVWLALQMAGRSGYVEMIGEDIRLSERLHTLVEAHPELEAHSQSLSINTFRFLPEDLNARSGEEAVAAYLDSLNGALLDRIQRSGELFVSHAVVAGRTVLRSCIVNFHTTEADIEAIPEIVARMGKEMDEEMRDAHLGYGR
jgi:glutamate/tyrosine decarboxylase-like PLP-dependent enzyme